MSTFEERSLTDLDGHLLRLYCRSCDQYFAGLLGDKECQVCVGIVTPEYQPSDAEMLDWLDTRHICVIKSPDTWATVEETTTGDTLGNGKSVREAIRAAMEAEKETKS